MSDMVSFSSWFRQDNKGATCHGANLSYFSEATFLQWSYVCCRYLNLKLYIYYYILFWKMRLSEFSKRPVLKGCCSVAFLKLQPWFKRGSVVSQTWASGNLGVIFHGYIVGIPCYRMTRSKNLVGDVVFQGPRKDCNQKSSRIQIWWSFVFWKLSMYFEASPRIYIFFLGWDVCNICKGRGQHDLAGDFYMV